MMYAKITLIGRTYAAGHVEFTLHQKNIKSSIQICPFGPHILLTHLADKFMSLDCFIEYISDHPINTIQDNIFKTNTFFISQTL